LFQKEQTVARARRRQILFARRGRRQFPLRRAGARVAGIFRPNRLSGAWPENRRQPSLNRLRQHY
jgi:hypothetical protein